MQASSVLQRFVPGLRSGAVCSVTGVSVHVRQGELDGACGLYCAAMGLTLLGQIRSPVELTKRKKGTAAALWEAYQPQYFDGTNAEELAQIISKASADTEVSWRWGACSELAKKVADGIQTGSIAVVGWQSRDGRHDHWVLAVGVEGHKRAGIFRPTALLCLDPSEVAPTLSAYNARIELGDKLLGSRAAFVKYVTNTNVVDVSLNEVVWMSAG